MEYKEVGAGVTLGAMFGRLYPRKGELVERQKNIRQEFDRRPDVRKMETSSETIYQFP